MTGIIASGDGGDEGTEEAGSDRAFGCTTGGILMVIGALKALLAPASSVAALAIFTGGAVLLLLGIAAPARLARLHRLWLRLGAAIAAVANPLILALLFVLVITPMALVMRLLHKRPLRLAADPAAGSYWLARDKPEDGPSSMRRQF